MKPSLRYRVLIKLLEKLPAKGAEVGSGTHQLIIEDLLTYPENYLQALCDRYYPTNYWSPEEKLARAAERVADAIIQERISI